MACSKCPPFESPTLRAEQPRWRGFKPPPKRRGILAGIHKCAKDIPNDRFIENMREIMELHPEYTWEKAYNDAMVLWTLHDYSAFKAMEEAVGNTLRAGVARSLRIDRQETRR